MDDFDHTETEQQAEIKYDDSTPQVTIDLAGTLGGAGWYEGDVTATVVADGDGLEIISTEIKIDGGGWTNYAVPAVVSGDGASNGMTGIYNTSSIQTQALGALTRADALFKAITKIRIVFGEPDWIAFNPNDYEDLRLQKDGMGRYLFGDPAGVG